MRTILAMVLAFVSLAPMGAQSYRPEWSSLDARATPQWFQDEKFGIFIHWGVYSVPAFAPVGKYAEWYWNHLSKGPQEKAKDGKLQPNKTWEFHKRVYGEQFPYFDFAPQFRAEMFEPEQWADVFARSGARYVVLTSKHHDGFALWPSKQADATWNRPWNAVSTGPKRDILGDLTNAVRAKGLRMGYYYSLYEWFNPLWKADRKRYVDEHMIPQFKDLVTRYKPAIIFSDGEWDMEGEDWKSPEILAWLYNESPVKNDVVVNDRWGKTTRHKHGGYYTTEYTAGLDTAGHPWEESRGMGFSYGYNRAEQWKDYRSDRELLLMLVDLVSRGGNLLLDIGPTADGRIPELMQERLVNMGRWLEKNGESIYGTRPFKRTGQWSEGSQPKLETGEYMTRYEVTDYIERKQAGQAIIEAFFTSKGGDLYAIVPRWPGSKFVIKDVAMPQQVTLLGRQGALKFARSGNGVEVQLPEPPMTAAEAQHAYVLKLGGSAK